MRLPSSHFIKKKNQTKALWRWVQSDDWSSRGYLPAIPFTPFCSVFSGLRSITSFFNVVGLHYQSGWVQGRSTRLSLLWESVHSHDSHGHRIERWIPSSIITIKTGHAQCASALRIWLVLMMLMTSGPFMILACTGVRVKRLMPVDGHCNERGNGVAWYEGCGWHVRYTRRQWSSPIDGMWE